MSDFAAGRSVLITGGSGSFGRAFARRLLDRHDPRRVIIFSRDEHKQAEMAATFADPRMRFFLGDVRDRERLRSAFAGVEIVVHAAALKRIEVGQFQPAEMVKTNVLGAMNVIDAAESAGVERVVALSTDKAWRPVSPYGQTKALAETLFLNANRLRGPRSPAYAVTRYGNVAGSAGSVIPKWRALLQAGKAIQVTDAECTRFWMTMDEACALVAETIETMEGGELAIPALPAFRLGDLAKAMGAGSVEEIGLPPWEKQHEGMSDVQTSDQARLMSVKELRDALRSV